VPRSRKDISSNGIWGWIGVGNVERQSRLSLFSIGDRSAHRWKAAMRNPVQPTIRAVRGKRAEATRPQDPSHSPIWLEIRDKSNQPGFDGTYVSVDDVPRDSFASHPWSIGGGGAVELRESIEDSAAFRLAELCPEIGVQVITGEEDVFARPRAAFKRADVISVRRFVTGNDIRNWTSFDHSLVF
jgi:hypothetical protein